MKLTDLETVKKYAYALKRVRIGIATVQGLEPRDQEDRLVDSYVATPYITIGGDVQPVPISSKTAVTVMRELEAYFLKKLNELGAHD